MTHVRHRRGLIASTAHSGGLTVRQKWASLFQENEIARREKRFADLKTDEELVQTMLTSFPDRWESCLMYQAARVRMMYNRRRKGGWFAGMGGRYRARRYAKANGKVYIASAHGKPEKFLGICKMVLDSEPEKDENEEHDTA